MKIFTITPRNEGQELNYVERFSGTVRKAKQRAYYIARELQKLLPQGSFSATVVDNKGREWDVRP